MGSLPPLARAILLGCMVSASMGAHQDEPVHVPGNGVSIPRVVKEVKPQYTADAMRRRVQGAVVMQCIVSREGVPTNIIVTEPLDEELDKEAVKALAQWRFEPGQKDGAPVSVRIPVEMTFSVRK